MAPAVHVYLIALKCTRGPGGRVSGHFKTVSCGILKLNMSWREFVILLIQTNHDTAADTPTQSPALCQYVQCMDIIKYSSKLTEISPLRASELISSSSCNIRK